MQRLRMHRATFVKNRHNSLDSQGEHSSPEHASPKNDDLHKTHSPGDKNLKRKNYFMHREASDRSIRERIDINDKSVEEMIKFSE